MPPPAAFRPTPSASPRRFRRVAASGRIAGFVAMPLPAAMALSMLLLAFATVPGCAPSPVAANTARSPYERYDALRGRNVPRTRIDSFGRERLNLEGRLGEASREQ